MIVEWMMQLLAGRAFGSAWYWLLMAVLWGFALQPPLGIPDGVTRRAHGGGAAGELLLDWLSLVLPGWRMTRTDAAVLAALAGFGASFLAYHAHQGLGGAQALLLLIAPLAGAFALRLRLAARLAALMAGAEAQPDEAAKAAARTLRRHRRVILGLAMASVAVASAWGSLWLLRHPWG